MDEVALSIGEVAREANVSASAIRFYERSGLLPEAERVSGKRRFGPDAVRRLEIIEIAKQAGFSLDEVRALLDSIDSGTPAHEELRALAARKLPEVEVLLERARAMRDWLVVASTCGCESLEDCGLFTGAS